jgi:probable rRNA maturation factor
MSSPEGSTVVFRHVPAGVRPLALTRFARRLQRDLCSGAPFDCLITTDAELRHLNRTFRGKDHATDVLSFPLMLTKSRARQGASVPQPPASSPESPSLGDLAISFPRARAQAAQFGHSPETELRILMLHGVLHLLGMDHETDGGGMARAESLWRTRLGLPNGLIERTTPRRRA